MENGLWQFFKWSMAGWIFFIESLFFLYIFKLMTPKSITFLDPILSQYNIQATIIIIALIGIPTGYIFYQIYYYCYWTLPASSISPPEKNYINNFLRNCVYCKHIPEKEQVNYLTTAQHSWVYKIKNSGLTKVLLWVVNIYKKIRRNEGKDHNYETVEDVAEFRNNWSTFKSAWYYSLATVENHKENMVSKNSAARRFEYMSFMYEGLGAVLFANWAAGMAAIAISLISLNYSLLEYGILFLAIVLISVILLLLRSAKKLRKKRYIAVVTWVALVIIMLAVKIGCGESIENIMGTNPYDYSEMSSYQTLLDFSEIITGVLVPVLIIGVISILHRIIWTNRAYYRLSMITLTERYICNLSCKVQCKK